MGAEAGLLREAGWMRCARAKRTRECESQVTVYVQWRALEAALGGKLSRSYLLGGGNTTIMQVDFPV